MSIIPKERPRLEFVPVWTAATNALLHDRGIFNHALLVGRCPVFVVAVRGYMKGVNAIRQYDDAIILLDTEVQTVLGQWNGNCDPGRFGWNREAGKPYAQVKSNIVLFFVPGPHKGRPGHYRQPSKAEAAAAGIPDVASDGRRLGYFDVWRVMDDDSRDEDIGYFAINIHEGGNYSTGSAGCQTMPAPQFCEFRDLAYARTARAQQKFLPWLVLDHL